MPINKQHLVKIVISILALILIGLAISGAVDQQGRDYTDSSFNKALITFGIARGINGVISVAQGTEVAIHPAGLGINFTPGQILDPINDIIEQFSWVMLASSASLGIQKVFLDIGSHWLTSALLTLLLIALLLFLWKESLIEKRTRQLIYKAVLIICFIRFSIPLAAIGTEYLYQYFLSDTYQESTEKLQNTQVAIGNLNEEYHQSTQTDNESMMDKAKKLFNSAAQSMDFNASIEQYKQAAADASRYTINLIVVFVIQTIMFPLIFLAIIYRFLKGLSKQVI